MTQPMHPTAPEPGAERDPNAITVDQALRQGTAFLRERGFESPRLEMELMMADAMGMDRLKLYLNLYNTLEPKVREKSRESLRRRVKREPLAYILGRKEFYGLVYEVTPDTLIPRPETEMVVDRALRFLRARAAADPAAGVSFADVGTGCGSIAVAVAATWRRRLVGAEEEAPPPPPAAGAALELSAAALEVARRNAARHGVADALEFFQGDLLAPLPGPVDLIVSNPPYIAEADRSILTPDVADWEPELALFSGPSGMTAILRLIEDAPAKLKPGGALIFEIGFGQGEAARAALEASGRYEEIVVHPDLAAIPRVAEARLKG